jgi:hypothetical protein
MVLRNVKGAMLNVFSKHAIICRSLASVSSPPNITTQPPPQTRLLPSTKDSQGIDSSSGIPDPMRVALDLLGELFSCELSSGLLSWSLHSVRLQSMDFIRFGEHYGESMGIHITLSAFVSNAPLKTIIPRNPIISSTLQYN